MYLGMNAVLDARERGSIAKYINHSCDPNCETSQWTVLGKFKMYIVAGKDIYGTVELPVELTFNYGWIIEDDMSISIMDANPCFCCSDNCTGSIFSMESDEECTTPTSASLGSVDTIQLGFASYIFLNNLN